jgi:hypothetical protein
MGETDPLRQEKRRGWFHPQSVIIGVLISSFLFAWNYWMLGFSPRFYRRNAAIIWGPVLSIVLSGLISSLAYSRWRKEKVARGFISLAICCWLATIFSSINGDKTFWGYMFNYFNYQDLAEYINIDPNYDQGQSYMDIGQIYFKESTYIATNKAIAFQNNGIYCAAPIVRQPIENQAGDNAVELQGELITPPSGTFDFWAVGTNCCDQTGENFKCGSVGHPQARSGIRMLRDDIRPFFFMAVQEWQGKLGLMAKHPLFFYWTVDPLFEVGQYKMKADERYNMHLLLFIFWNIIISGAVSFTLQKAGIK